jgi:hypothetical protein
MQCLPIRKNVGPGYVFTSVAAPRHQGMRSTSVGRPHFLPEPGRTALRDRKVPSPLSGPPIQLGRPPLTEASPGLYPGLVQEY